MYFTYVLYSDKLRKFYTGYTSNLDRRLRHHNLGLNRWSKRGMPWKVVYAEKFINKSDAIKRENYLKTGHGRDYIQAEVAKSVTAGA